MSLHSPSNEQNAGTIDSRTEDFPVESFRHVEEIIQCLRKDSMGRASRFANAVTPKNEEIYTVNEESLGFGLEMALRNPSAELLRTAGLLPNAEE